MKERKEEKKKKKKKGMEYYGFVWKLFVYGLKWFCMDVRIAKGWYGY